MTVSLIISTYNWPRALYLCLDSVMQQTVMPSEIIIADDGSGIATRDVVRHFEAVSPVPVRHIWHEDDGFRLAEIRNKKLGFVFQDFLLLDGLTVRQNILLPAIIGGTVSNMTEQRADQLCEVFGIAGIRDKYPAEISGGEKQRTAVARALINHPLLILADEPTGNLDSKSTRAVIRSFEQAKQALEATIFMVTHDSYAASFCDRVVILRDGVVWKVLEKGATERETFQDQLLDAVREMGRE